MKMRKSITYVTFLVILAISITATCIAAPGAALVANNASSSAYKMAVQVVKCSGSATLQNSKTQPPKIMDAAKAFIPNMEDPMNELVTLSGQTKDALVVAYPKMNPWQIADKLGDLDALKAAILADTKASLDALVASGKITSDAETTQYTAIQNFINGITSATVGSMPPPPICVKPGDPSAVMVPIDPMNELVTLSGQTKDALIAAYPKMNPWQIADKLGDLDALKAAVLTDTKAALDALVASGKLTSDAEATQYTAIQNLINGITSATVGSMPSPPPVCVKPGCPGSVISPMIDPMNELVTLSGQTKDALIAAYPNMNPWQIADKLGNLDALKAAVLTDTKAALDALVASGKLTSDAEATQYAAIEKSINAITSATVGSTPSPAPICVKPVCPIAPISPMIDPMNELVTLSGQTKDALIAAYPNMNPWQIADKLGNLDALKAAVLTDTKAALDALVASGKLTSDAEATQYAAIEKSINAITSATVGSTPPPPPTPTTGKGGCNCVPNGGNNKPPVAPVAPPANTSSTSSTSSTLVNGKVAGNPPIGGGCPKQPIAPPAKAPKK